MSDEKKPRRTRTTSCFHLGSDITKWAVRTHTSFRVLSIDAPGIDLDLFVENDDAADVAKRLRQWADRLDPPPEPSGVAPHRGGESRKPQEERESGPLPLFDQITRDAREQEDRIVAERRTRGDGLLGLAREMEAKDQGWTPERPDGLPPMGGSSWAARNRLN